MGNWENKKEEIEKIEAEKEGWEKMKLEFESFSYNESFARVVVSAFMARMDPTLEELDDVKTAVSEAVTNSIIHGYQKKEGVVTIKGSRNGKIIEILIEDRGAGIPNIEKAMEPLYTSAKGGERSGMGFSFMEAFMDELQVISEMGKGTIIKMKKTLGKRPYE